MGSSIRSLVCLTALAVAALPEAVRIDAQATAEKKGKIAALHAVGSRKYPEEKIVAATGLRLGDLAGREELQAAADRLAELGPFTKVGYRFTSREEKLTIEFQVEDAPTLPVSFDNFPWFTDAELTEALQQSVPLFDGTAPEQGALIDVMKETLEKLLAAHGVHGAVEHVLMAQPASDAMMQQFKLVGASLKIEAVRFEDALATQSKRVHDRLSDLVGKAYSRFSVEVFAQEQVRPLYLEQGHLRVRIGKPVARFTGPADRPLPDSVLVIVPIDPGPIYHWGGVEWHGNLAFGPRALDDLLGLKAGEVANGMKIAGNWDRVQNEYGRVGYLDAKIEPQALFDDAAGRVSYRVNITEGSQYRMGDLVVSGLSLAAEAKLRAAWKIAPGEIFNRNEFERLWTKLEKPSADVFGELPVHYEQPGRWLRTNSQAHTVDVLLDFSK